MSKLIILARSPYLVDVDETGSIGSEVQLFIWNGTGSAPGTPTYKLSKKTARPTETRTEYDIAPYVRDFLRANYTQTNSIDYSTPVSDYNSDFWCNVLVKYYNTTTAGTEYLGETNFYAFDGYLNSRDDFSLNGNSLLAGQPIVMYSNSGPINVPTQLTYPPANIYITQYAQFPVITNGNGCYFQVQGSEFIYTIETDNPVFITLLTQFTYPPEDENTIINVYNSEDEIIYTFTITPKCLPKYRPILLEFVNRFGVWQRCWFFGADYESINATSDNYKLMQNIVTYPNYQNGYYNYKQGQIFNRNGVKTFKVNTDWVDEQWNVCLEEIMMSENLILSYYINVDGFSDTSSLKYSYPVKLNTNSIQLNRHINEKLINYTLEFEYLSPIVNNII